MEFAIRALKQGLGRWAPDWVYIPFVNGKSFLKRRAQRLSANGDGLYRVDDKQGDSIYLSQRSRHSRYKRGIAFWADRLANQYCLGSMQLNPGGVLIDCGANIGEIGIWASNRGLKYHAFEPEEREARCCDLNNYGGEPKTNRLGLWYETGELKFYSKGESADSSLIPIAKFDAVVVVKTKTLDEYIAEQDIKAIEVLKVEAEGAEPEVLRGSQEALKITRYVAVDCGRERGINHEDTIRDVSNQLYSCGYKMVDTNMDRFVLLFENEAVAMANAVIPSKETLSPSSHRKTLACA